MRTVPESVFDLRAVAVCGAALCDIILPHAKTPANRHLPRLVSRQGRTVIPFVAARGKGRSAAAH
jgi:hypothetical protein